MSQLRLESLCSLEPFGARLSLDETPHSLLEFCAFLFDAAKRHDLLLVRNTPNLPRRVGPLGEHEGFSYSVHFASEVRNARNAVELSNSGPYHPHWDFVNRPDAPSQAIHLFDMPFAQPTDLPMGFAPMKGTIAMYREALEKTHTYLLQLGDFEEAQKVFSVQEKLSGRFTDESYRLMAGMAYALRTSDACEFFLDSLHKFASTHGLVHEFSPRDCMVLRHQGYLGPSHFRGGNPRDAHALPTPLYSTFLVRTPLNKKSI